MADIKHVIVVMMENRSFDEYFGTFPGAENFFGPSPAIPQSWPSQPNGSLYPYRASTFTTNSLSAPSLGHDWNTMHTAAGLDDPSGNTELSSVANNLGFYSACGQNPKALSCFVQNDIPYHWALAQNFALCDHYFCSALAATYPNRVFATSGTVDPMPQPPDNVYVFSSETETWLRREAGWQVPPPDQQGPLIDNMAGTSNANSNTSDPANMTPAVAWTQLPWGSYLSDLRASVHWSDAAPLYTVYDDWNWMPQAAQNAFSLYAGTFASNDLNVFAYYNDGFGIRGDTAGAVPVYKESISAPSYLPDQPLQIELDLRSGKLAPVSWVFPPYCLCEHPPFTHADGAYYLSRIVDAVIASPLWLNTVLVITYDETDTHFDHLPPPLSPDPRPPNGPPTPYEPWVSDVGGTYDNPYPVAAPMGGGMRVPAIIVSPWTYRAGVISDQMDHTSLLQMMESVTNVSVSRLPAKGTALGWRRATFGNMFNAIKNLNMSPVVANQIDRTAATGVPTQEMALQWQTTAWTRLNLIGVPPNAQGASPAPPSSQSGSSAAQSCELIMPIGSYDLADVKQAANGGTIATFQGALKVRVVGFEPTELTCDDGQAVSQLNTSGNQSNITVNSPTGPCATRIPTVTFSNPNISVDLQTISIDEDPNTITTEQGVPQTFTFTYDLVFQNFAQIFPPGPTGQGAPGTTNIYTVTATFQVDASFTAGAELELVSTADPQFYKNFTDDTTWLSGELVVFSLPAGQSMFGTPPLGDPAHPTEATSVDALNFINQAIDNLNSGAAAANAFDALNAPEAANPLSLVLTPPGATPIFNFALARVHMNSVNPANNVRVFFRSGRASVTTGAYDASGPTTGPSYTPAFYRSNPATGPGKGSNDVKIPLLGVELVTPPGGDGATLEYTSIPFFATPRVNVSDPTQPMTNQGPDSPAQLGIASSLGNVRNIPAASGGTPSIAYFGCWLDINQNVKLIPTTIPPTPSQWDGPFNNMNPISVQRAFLSDLHQCLVAEISFDQITIPQGDIPGYSAWLAQRNLGLVTS